MKYLPLDDFLRSPRGETGIIFVSVAFLKFSTSLISALNSADSFDTQSGFKLVDEVVSAGSSSIGLTIVGSRLSNQKRLPRTVNLVEER